MPSNKNKGKEVAEELYDTKKRPIHQIDYTGDFVKLISDVLKYVKTASNNDEFFRVSMYQKLLVYLRIFDLYVLAYRRLIAAVLLQQAAAEASSSAPKKMVTKKVHKKNKEIAKLEATLGSEVIYVFRNKNDQRRYFKDAEFLPFDESYQGRVKSNVGIQALETATDKIFKYIKTDPGRCHGAMFTMVYMISEATRFIPIYDCVKGLLDEAAPAWFRPLVKDWERYSKLARTKDDSVTPLALYDPSEVLSEQIILDRKFDAAWADSILSLMHGFRTELASPLCSPPPIERRRGVSSIDFMAYEFEHPDALSHGDGCLIVEEEPTCRRFGVGYDRFNDMAQRDSIFFRLSCQERNSKPKAILKRRRGSDLREFFNGKVVGGSLFEGNNVNHRIRGSIGRQLPCVGIDFDNNKPPFRDKSVMKSIIYLQLLLGQGSQRSQQDHPVLTLLFLQNPRALPKSKKRRRKHKVVDGSFFKGYDSNHRIRGNSERHVPRVGIDLSNKRRRKHCKGRLT